MDRDAEELKALLASGPMRYSLTPDEYDELQDRGFLVVPVDAEAGVDGKKLCTISLRLS